MNAVELARRRASAVGLAGLLGRTPVDVVQWFGAMQSQEYGPAKWAVGQRVGDVTDAELDRAFNDGIILRTHVLRPTWHFVAPTDIRWLLELTAPRVHALNAYYYRQQELDDTVFARSNALIKAALSGENQLTRKEIGAVLARGGVTAAGIRLGYILINAELERLVCSGPLNGKQHTYALLDERAPAARTLSHDEALAELTLRYFTSHGPSTTKDFSWWSSLTAADITAGLEMVGSKLESYDVEGLTYWSAPSGRPRRVTEPHVQLLQPYDEYIVGYSKSKFLLDTAGVAGSLPTNTAIYNGVVIRDTQVAGHWKRTVAKDEVIIDVALYYAFSEAEMHALHAAGNAHGAFLGRTAILRPTQL